MAETTHNQAGSEALEREALRSTQNPGGKDQASHQAVSAPAQDAASAWTAALRTPLVMGLGALLGLQLLLAAAISGGGRLAPTATDMPLAAFDAEQVDSIEIASANGDGGLILARAADGWIVPSRDDFPADASRVEELLETLAHLHRPLPIATSAAAQERFKVADALFAQRIALRDGKDTLATLFLGDSPGFRRRYLRPAGDEGTYDVRFEVFNLSDQPDDWIARDQLRLERERIRRLAANDWALIKQGEEWTLEGGPAQGERELDPIKVDALLTAVANLGYRAVLGKETPAGFDPEAPMLALEVGLDGDARQSYLIGAGRGDESSGGQEYVLKVADSPYYFLLSDFDLGPLVGLDAGGLLKPTAEEGEGQTPDSAASQVSDSAVGRDQGSAIASESAAGDVAE